MQGIPRNYLPSFGTRGLGGTPPLVGPLLTFLGVNKFLNGLSNEGESHDTDLQWLLNQAYCAISVVCRLPRIPQASGRAAVACSTTPPSFTQHSSGSHRARACTAHHPDSLHRFAMRSFARLSSLLWFLSSLKSSGVNSFIAVSLACLLSPSVTKTSPSAAKL